MEMERSEDLRDEMAMAAVKKMKMKLREKWKKREKGEIGNDM